MLTTPARYVPREGRKRRKVVVSQMNVGPLSSIHCERACAALGARSLLLVGFLGSGEVEVEGKGGADVGSVRSSGGSSDMEAEW